MFESYPQYEYLCAQVQLVLFMLGMGATLRAADFLGIWQQPHSFLLGALGQFVLTPMLALLVSWGAGLEPGIAVGLILISAMPGGTLAKAFTVLGRGNIALSITLTIFGTLIALASVPVLLRLLAADYVPAEFTMPVGAVLRDLVLYLLLPLGGGILVARRWPGGAKSFSRWCIRLGFLAVVVMVTGSLGSGRIHPGAHGWLVAVAIIAFCVLAQQLSMLPLRLLRWPRPDVLSVGIEVTMRNLNLALLLKALLFPADSPGHELGDGVLFVILFYAGAAMGAGLPLALMFRRRIRRAEMDIPLKPQRGGSQ